MSPKKMENRYKAIIEHCKTMEAESHILAYTEWVRNHLRFPIEQLLSERRKDRAIKTLISVANKALFTATVKDCSDSSNYVKQKSNLTYLARYCVDSVEWIIYP